MAGNVAPNTVTNGLVLYLDAGNTNSYPGTGTSWRDISGNSNNGTLTNGPTFNSANGGSIVFDGTNDFVVGTIVVPASFTFNCILRPTSLTQFGPEFNIWPNYPTGDRGWNIFSLTSGGPGSTGAFVGIDVATRWSPSDTTNFLILNTIQNLTFTHENGVSRLYRNGSLFAQKNQTAPINVGQTKYYTLFSNPTYGAGNLYTTQFYNRALSATEITQNYNALKGRYGL